ncbi:ABC transporter ATP-binding protein [Actinokineospora bangkokensis]|uniref:Lipoprotein ABC transporter ATP-binding protein n=1 Tax=Actinokineospora bangkokensis TaxID=1193682 RepID=A0A1Q9LIL7_9PSEU|nr:ABC transporter ATP-binding protein [Actinokineospora bangkokensis]OLR91850.1 lipoprotein ABC transporter ATP-binding protein [Actinokineospora bangkokensis]
MLTTRALTMAYGPRTLWRDLDLTVERGRLTALTGPSGSGKSTLLNCLGLLETPTAGRITFHGTTLTGLRPGAVRRFRRDHLGYLFQNYALVENATIAQNLDVALRARGHRGRPARAAAAHALTRVGLADREQDRVSKLSGGEQQRVAVARLMVKQPSLVLADEPTGALDHANTATVVTLLRAMADEGACVVIATHDTWVRDQCDDVIDVG